MLDIPQGDPFDFGGGFDSGFDLDDFLGELDAPLFEDSLGGMAGEAPITLQGEDLARFQFRLEQSLAQAKGQMAGIHEDARHDRRVYDVMERAQEYEGQPNLTTPISANKADGLLAHIVDAIEQRPMASFSPEGIGAPAEKAARVAPLCAAYLEREINRGGSRERLIRELSKEAVVVGTGIAKLAMVQHPSGEWFTQVGEIIPIERFYVNRIRVSNLKHVFSAYQERYPYYQLEEMADAGLLDRDALERIRASHETPLPSETEMEAGFWEAQHSYQEETAVHTIHYCYLRFRPDGASKAELYEAVYHEQHRVLLAVRPNPAREAFDHPPLALVRVGKKPGHLFGRGIIRRLAPIQRMADNAVNSHLAINDLAASPPFQYKQNSPFGRLMSERRRLVPGIGIPTLGTPDKGDVQPLQFNNPGLSLQDISVAQSFADKATYTEEAIGSTSDRKTLGQFRVEMQRGTMRVRLDLGDLAYDMSQLLTMMWSMVLAYKVKPAGIVEVEEGGKFLGAREIDTDEITELMDAIIMPLFQQGQIDVAVLEQFEAEFNDKLTDSTVPSGRRSDLTISLSGTKVIADKATELEMLVELTPYILQGLELAKVDTYFNYHLRSILEAMGFKDIDKRIPADPGVVTDQETRQQLGEPLAQTINHSSHMV